LVRLPGDLGEKSSDEGQREVRAGEVRCVVASSALGSIGAAFWTFVQIGSSAPVNNRQGIRIALRLTLPGGCPCRVMVRVVMVVGVMALPDDCKKRQCWLAPPL
jgi:hypothetical protein